MTTFHKHYVTNGVIKAKVRYSTNITVKTGKKCITLYEKDYGNNLPKVLTNVKNDSDVMTDYFEENRCIFLEGSKEYTHLLPRLREWGLMYA